MIERDVFRRWVRRGCLCVAACGGTWSAWLLAGGGATVRVLGLVITSHSPLRPLLVGSIALSVFLVTGGQIPLPSRRRLASVIEGVGTAVRFIPRLKPPDWMLATALALALAVVGWISGAKAVGGADSYGYASEADGLISGGVRLVQPWVSQVPWPSAIETFTPQGYAPLPDGSAIVPMYAPGLPLLMAAAKIVAGHCAIFSITPISAALLVLATFGLGRRLGSDAAGLIAAWLVATSPVVLFMLQTPMSDIPAAAAWASAFYAATFVTGRAAFCSGVAVGIAVMIRLNLAPMAVIPAAWYLARSWRTTGSARWRLVAMYITGLLPSLLIALVFNAFVNGNPLQLGYTRTAGWFSLDHVLPNLRSYCRWFIDTQTPVAAVGVVALLLPVRGLWRDRGGAIAGAVFVGTTLAMYCAYMEFGAWWFLRFLLPCWPFIMVGVGQVAVRTSRRPMVALGIAGIIVWAGVFGFQYAQRVSVFDLGAGDLKFPATGHQVAAVSEPRSVIVSSYHSGSLRYYAGRMTIDFRALDPAWLDRAVAWMTERGVHVYALLEADEVGQFRGRFAGTLTVERMNSPLVTVAPWAIFLYDLSAPQRPPIPVPAADPAGFACTSPQPRPSIDFTPSAR